MFTTCPKCGSIAVDRLLTGRRVGGSVGAVFGAIRGARAASTAAKTVVALGTAANPVAFTSKTVFAALVGGINGVIIGSTFGEVLDRTVLDNHECLRCKHTFNVDLE